LKNIFLLLLLPIFGSSQSTLIFSEYGEGSSNNKWVEIYNPTFQNISLDEYRYNFCWNGCDSLEWEFSIPFDSGHIMLPGGTYLLAHHNADSILLNTANQTTNILSNGNDVAGLFNISFNTIIDIIGILDSSNNINAWDIGGVLNATQNHTMIRKPDVCGGNIGDWSLSDGSIYNSQWILGIEDDFSSLNTHNSNCINSTSINILIPSKKKLLEVKDLLGRLVNDKKKHQIQLYIYSDGSVDKVIITN
jgi:hypothetical protein|tara:strand:- start:703 stop:1446 length:744 start_codon:yes stop_codon:yes gene_type:complete